MQFDTISALPILLPPPLLPGPGACLHLSCFNVINMVSFFHRLLRRSLLTMLSLSLSSFLPSLHSTRECIAELYIGVGALKIEVTRLAILLNDRIERHFYVNDNIDIGRNKK